MMTPVLRAVRGLRWALLLTGLAVGSLAVTWHALATIDFGYSTWYDALAIDRTIETFGPRNTIRPDFHRTDREERERVFGAIVDAIHDDGRGLRELTYHEPDGRPLGRLLTPAEIVHLTDVARLIDRATRLGWLGVAVFVLLAAGAALRRERPPSGPRLVGVTAGVVGALAAAVLLIGPVRVFYGLHVAFFPAGHQWYFHYEESLMSMMMQAPNLFGPIAVTWVLLAFGCGAAAWIALARGLRRLAGN